MKYSKNIRLKNGEDCLIRSALVDDAQGVIETFYKTHSETDYLASNKGDKIIDLSFEESFLNEKLNSDKEVYLCAVVNGSIVGTAGVFQLGQNKIAHRAEVGIAVEKDFWSIGIGRALLMSGIDCAKNAGFSQIELEVVSDNQNAIALYRSLGFIEFGRNPRGFITHNDKWQELVSMRLELG